MVLHWPYICSYQGLSKAADESGKQRDWHPCFSPVSYANLMISLFLSSRGYLPFAEMNLLFSLNVLYLVQMFKVEQ